MTPEEKLDEILKTLDLLIRVMKSQDKMFALRWEQELRKRKAKSS